MSTAAEVDKKAADAEFLGNICEHALTDAKGIAPQWVKQKLRSEQFHFEWAKALALLCTRVTDIGTKHCINERRMEASTLKKQYIKVRDADCVTISAHVKAITGLDLTGETQHEIGLILSAHLLNEMRGIRTLLEKESP